MACPDCGSAVRPLLTIASGEWNGGSRSRRPLEDTDRTPAGPTLLSYDHPHLQNIQ
ncbi:hypothetical protein [Streptomyces sp. V4I2]|uniref:hypothetical protein n=1 Tax=Streptomyces sp. V4I2 TaxID=3042280 RepID=UPI0027D87C57|nr:hypothetical protein [Streptomyces sp. V4I2]